MLLHAAIIASSLHATPTEDPEALFPNTRLEINASAIAEDGGTEDPALWEDIIAAQLTEEFQRYHIPLITMGEAATFNATLSWAGGDDSTDIEIVVEVTKQDTAPETRTFVCEECEFAPGAAARIIEELPTLVPLLEQPAPTTPPEHPEVKDDPPPPRERAITGLGWGGIATSIVGAGLIGGGAFMLTREETESSVNDMREFTLTDTHPLKVPGIALAATGGAAVIGGITMIVVDLRRQKKKNANAKDKPSATLAPSLLTPGFVLSGRF